MCRSSTNTEAHRKNSAECLALFGSAICDYLAELRQNFWVTFAALHLWRFALAAHVNLKSLHCSHLLTIVSS